MTRELLEQYADLCAEIGDLERQAQSALQREQRPLLLERRDRLAAQRDEIEAFVGTLPTSRQRRVVDYRGLQGMPWAQVAAKLGHRSSVDSAKHCYYRAFDPEK